MLLQTKAIPGPVFKNLSSTITGLWVVKTAYDSSEQQQIAVSIESYWKQKETQNNKDHTFDAKNKSLMTDKDTSGSENKQRNNLCFWLPWF